MHVLIAKHEERWGAWLQEAPGLAFSPIHNDRRLEPVIDAAIDLAFKTTPPMAFSFSTRQLGDVAGNIAEHPEELATVDMGVEVDVLMAEGRYAGDDRWALVMRQARTGRLWSLGLDGTFRERALKDRIKRWFEDWDWRSFGPPNPRYPDARPPPWDRELYVRHGEAWKARLITPSDFPTFTPGPIVTDEQRARQISRMPQRRSEVRRARHAANDARFKAEAEARRIQREQQAEAQ